MRMGGLLTYYRLCVANGLQLSIPRYLSFSLLTYSAYHSSDNQPLMTWASASSPRWTCRRRRRRARAHLPSPRRTGRGKSRSSGSSGSSSTSAHKVAMGARKATTGCFEAQLLAQMHEGGARPRRPRRGGEVPRQRRRRRRRQQWWCLQQRARSPEGHSQARPRQWLARLRR